MARIIEDAEYHTGADTDALNGTKLETAPGRGVFIIKVASTVNTATLTLKTDRSIVAEAEPIPLRANGVPDAGDKPWVIPVRRGDRVDLELGGTTGTILRKVTYVGA